MDPRAKFYEAITKPLPIALPPATFRVLFVLVVLSHERRRVCRHNDAHIIDVFDEIVFALFKPHNLFSNAMMQAAVDGHTAQQPRVWLLPFSPSGLTCFGLLFNCAISTKRHF